MASLSGVTLTGIDQTTDLDQAIALSHRHPLLEWGILLGGTPSPRYPSLSFIQQWSSHADRAGVKTAMHLCGKFARAWIEGDADIIELARRFSRIQVNVVAARTDVDALVAAIAHRRHPHVITQHNAANEEITTRLAHVAAHAILFDASGGRGVGPDMWPVPVPGKMCGYAGGMGPDNVTHELDRIEAQVGAHAFWIDMEGRVRTPEDTLDLSACQQVLAQVDNWVALRSPSRKATP